MAANPLQLPDADTLTAAEAPADDEPLAADEVLADTRVAGAWNGLMHALGHDLQHGIRRTQLATRRIRAR